MVRREAGVHQFAYFDKPPVALFVGAGDHHRKRNTPHVRDPAQTEYASLPDQLERIPKGRPLSVGGSVGRVEDERCPCLEQTNRDAFAAISLEEGVGDAGPDDPVNPSLQNRGRLAPPIGMHDCDAVRRRDLLAVFDERRRELDRAGGDLRAREKGVEPLPVEVVGSDFVTVEEQSFGDDLGDGVIEAAGDWMGEND